MSELFEIPQQDSPRLKWLKQHGVHTKRYDYRPSIWCAYVGVNVFPKPNNLFGEGYTEHEAIVDLAIKRGWKLWNEI